MHDSGRHLSGSDSVRTLTARCAAHESWACTKDRSARTAPARKASGDRFLKLARERFGDLPEDDLRKRADHLKSAHYARMALKSAQVRRRKAGSK